MQYDTIIIGAGLSGLSAASLLAKRGLSVAVAEHADKPGGTCGVFKRKGAIFDQGAAMLYGFGSSGFNAHRFLFNCLEEPFHVIRHDLLYVVHYNGTPIHFYPDLDAFIEELSIAFPSQKKNIRRFYQRMHKLYTHVMSQSPSYTTPDETNLKEGLRSFTRHPVSYIKFLSYLNMSTEKLLLKYFDDPQILKFFDKLTSTYCYATVAEAPAILASVMFIDNHEGGSYYPAGSTLFLPGILEKIIEAHDGDLYYNSTVSRLLFEGNSCRGVVLENGQKLFAKNVIYSGTVWDLYEKLLPKSLLEGREKSWAASQIPTYSSIVLYALIHSSVIPKDTCPIEMLASKSGAIDESEVTIYIPSIDDHTLCPANQHVVTAIGPSFLKWEKKDSATYEKQKDRETQRMLHLLEQRFPGFSHGLIHAELATPSTIEDYTMKRGGAAAGPKQMLGQHMLLRQPIRTRWDSLFCCGESTTMGTGTPTVTTSGIAAANAVLKKYHLSPFVWNSSMQNYVTILPHPIEREWLYQVYPSDEAALMTMAGRCQYCSAPSCCPKERLDIPGILRRTACGNFAGALKVMRQTIFAESELFHMENGFLRDCEENCIRKNTTDGAVPLQTIFSMLLQKTSAH